jgi:hypothetical protein
MTITAVLRLWRWRPGQPIGPKRLADGYGDDAIEGYGRQLDGAESTRSVDNLHEKLPDYDVQRSLIGPLMEEDAFNRQVTKGIRRVVREYQIRIHPEHIINQDDELADRTWQAALDFLAACGVYNQSTARVICTAGQSCSAPLQMLRTRSGCGSGRRGT